MGDLFFFAKHRFVAATRHIVFARRRSDFDLDGLLGR